MTVGAAERVVRKVAFATLAALSGRARYRFGTHFWDTRSLVALWLAVVMAVAPFNASAHYRASHEVSTVAALSAALGHSVVLCHTDDGPSGTPVVPGHEREACLDCCVLCRVAAHVAAIVPPGIAGPNVGEEYSRLIFVFQDAGGSRTPPHGLAQPRGPPVTA